MDLSHLNPAYEVPPDVLSHPDNPLGLVWQKLLNTVTVDDTPQQAAPGFIERANKQAEEFFTRNCDYEIQLLTTLTSGYESGEYKVAYESEFDQLKTLIKRLPAHAFRIAERYIEQDLEFSLSVLRENRYGEGLSVWPFLYSTISGKKAADHKKMQAGHVLGFYGDHTLIDTAVRSAGGWRQVQAYALCQTIISDTLCFFQHAGDYVAAVDDTGWVARPFWRDTLAIEEVWNERYLPLTRLALALPDAKVWDFVTHLHQEAAFRLTTFRRNLKLHSGLQQEADLSRNEATQLRRQGDSLKRKLNGTSNDLAVAKKEITELRSGKNKAQQEIARLNHRIGSLEKQLGATKDDTTSKAMTPDAPVPHHDADQGLMAVVKSLETENKALRQDRETSELELADAMEEVRNVRQFATLLLYAPPDTQATESTVDTGERFLSQMRIIVVGGHERLHAKLRAELPNSVFLHPDKSQFSPDLFDSADGVLFAVDYCSHALTWRAAQEARKRNVPAGYTTHVNVEMVLEDIRAIVMKAPETITA